MFRARTWERMHKGRYHNKEFALWEISKSSHLILICVGRRSSEAAFVTCHQRKKGWSSAADLSLILLASLECHLEQQFE